MLCLFDIPLGPLHLSCWPHRRGNHLSDEVNRNGKQTNMTFIRLGHFMGLNRGHSCGYHTDRESGV